MVCSQAGGRWTDWRPAAQRVQTLRAAVAGVGGGGGADRYGEGGVLVDERQHAVAELAGRAAARVSTPSFFRQQPLLATIAAAARGLVANTARCSDAASEVAAMAANRG